MKKLSLFLAALMISGASFACDGNKDCKGDKACCKKEAKKEAKACCKKDATASKDKEGKACCKKNTEEKTAQK